MTIEEEKELVRRAQQGDRTVLGPLWDEITPKLYGYLINTLKNREVAEDVLQDTWLTAIQKIHQFEPRGVRFSAWLFAIARNRCRDVWRRHREIPLEEHHDVPVKPEVASGNDALGIEQMIRRLSQDDQDMLRLCYIAELSMKEIALALDCTPLAARVRMHRARKRAQKLLSQPL